MSCEIPDSFCINIGVTQPGQVEVILDFVNNGIYDADTTDVIIAMFFEEADTICIPWDGLKGDGSPIGFGEVVPTVVRYSQGVQHYAAFDVEFLKNGFCVQTIRPVCPGVSTDLLYWDDSQITDDVVTVTIDEGDPGTGQPKVEFNGCTCGVGGCRTWDNFQIGDPPTGTCVGTPFGYGENATLNTWWFASTIIISGVNLPLVQVNITGDNEICNGDSTIFIAEVTPDTIDYVFSWTGPNGFTSSDSTTGYVDVAGTYIVSILDTLSDCEAMDTIVLSVLANPTTSITFTCLGPNQENANVDLTVSGGNPPYTYLWSNGATTEDLTNVPPGQYSVIVTDESGCQAFDTVTVTGCCELVVICPPSDGGTYGCVDDVPAIDTSIVDVTQYCLSYTNVGVDTDNGGTGCPGDPLIITRTFTITDGLGNTATCVQTITVVDDVLPVLTCPANITITCTASTLPASTGTATATDNCDPTLEVTFSDVVAAGTCPQESTITRTWTATDDCGNVGSCVQTIVVDDSVAPVVTCPANVTIACLTSTLPAATGTATASDNCDSAPLVAFTDVVVAGTCPQESTITRTWTATDDCGNTGSCTQTIVVDDSLAPSINCPPNVTIECTASTLPANTGTPTGTDNCDGTPTFAFADVTVAGTCPQERTITRTWTASDDCGNTNTCVQTIVVDDSVAPSITCPANVTIQCTASTLPANTGTATATDNCDGTPVVAFTDLTVAGACPQAATITRTWTATDDCGNVSSCIQTIQVVDTTPPVITCPANVTIACSASTLPAATGTATATDCDPTPTITSSDVTVAGSCPQEYTITRTWVATDDCGNSSSCVQTIVLDDSVAPSITCPANVTIECSGSTDPGTTGTATATDNCDGEPTIDFSDVTVAGVCAQGINITRTWVATDACGNSSTCVQSIILDDIVPPAIICPADVTIECTDSTLPADTGTPTGTDNCDPTPLFAFTDVSAPGACPQESIITRTWSATDDCGNTSTCIQTITVDDSVPPTVSCPADVTIECEDSTLPANTGTATASDNCGGTPTVDFSDITTEGSCAQEYSITRSWTATDACGNATNCIQIISIQDNTAPVITCPANVTVQCTDSTDPLDTGTATATDCDPTPTISSSDVTAAGACPQEYTITRTWVATDDCGNSSSCTQTIFVDDSVAPIITCPANVTILCTDSTAPANTGTATASDNCDPAPTVNFVDATVAGACTQEFTINRTWTATDACGNTSTCLQVIVRDDNAPPSITCPPNVTVTCASAVPPVNTASVTTSDNCSTVTVSLLSDVITNQTCPNNFTLTRTYLATDACGNTATCTQIITVQDPIAPTITCPANVTVSCASAVPAANPASVIASDNCGGVVTVTHVTDVISNQGCVNFFTVTRTYQATDVCGNSSTCTQTITVNDQTPPVASCQNITIDFASGTEVTITPEQINNNSTDNCGGPVTLALSQTVFNCSEFIGVNSVPVTLTVTDACGNTSTCVAQVMGVGGLLEINCPSDIIIYLNAGECSAFVNYEVTADAICGGTPVLSQTDTTGLTSGDAFPIGTTIQTWIATNMSDTAECSFNITVIEYDGPIQLACNDTINVSVDNNCEAHIFADMILEGDLYGCYDDYIITIENVGTDTGWIVFNAVDLLNGCYNVTITDPDSGNSCWGVICLEDKIAPQIICACPPGEDGADTCQISCLEVDILLDGNIPPNLYPTIIDNCGYTLVVDNIELNDQGCGESTVIVTWLVTDNSGHSASCEQEFEVIPLSADSLVFPPNFEGNCGTSSDPDVTGWPTIGGYELTDEAGLCNLFLGYWDKPLDDCGGGVKILRTWTVLDWCTLELIEATQIIKLSDTEGPVLTCPADLSVGTDFWYCYANVSVPKPLAYDECSEVVSFSLASSSGVIVQFGNNFVINGLELGTHILTWTVTDLCGNSSTCTFTITVEDNVVPVANCDFHTIVSLTNDGPAGITLVPAEVFDDGSYDNCGPVTFRARRMDSCIDFDWTTNGACVDHVPNGFVNSSDLGTSFKPCVPFACCDVPRTGSRGSMQDTVIMVQLEVTDQSGNVNYCMVEVEVQDKLAPFVECPPDIYVSCDFWFPAQEGVYRDAAGNFNGNLDEDPLSSIFGNMYDALANNDDESVRQPIIINDPGNTQYPQPYNWGLDGWSDDNCLSDLEVRVRIFDDCSGNDLPGNAPAGAVRLIERRFTVRDNNQGFNPAVCTQRIWVVDFEPFYISDNTCNNQDPNDGVIWPCDILITNCPDDIGNTGEPQIFSDACSLIGITYEDTRFEFADGACYKILRDWKVIDWCQYNAATGYGLWSYTQVIKVKDEQAAEFLECPSEPVVLCVENDGVRLPATNQAFLGENNPLSSSCSVHVTMIQRIREACNQEVAFDVKIYPFNGTEFIQAKPRTIVALDDNHEADLVFNTEESTIQDIRRDGLPYNDPYCGDYHRILWSVEDGCGNWSHCEYLFRLEDCKQPSPVCINGLSTVVMPVGCEVTLWAKDFNASSFDDCTAAADLLYSFSGDAYEPSRTFNATNIPAFGVEIAIQIWVADGGTDDNCNGIISWNERNKDYCTTTVVFTDNSGNCDHSGSILYEGEIFTYHEQAVEAVNVSLINNNQTIFAMNTVDNGKYLLVVPEIDGQRYTIKPQRLDQPRNGVSTLDLVRIQKHLLGKELFDSPYQYIAADANNNQQLSAIDLIEIRKLILGIYTEFPVNESWRFVDKNYLMANPQNPWPFDEEINIQYEGVSVSGLDFVAVKVGDVNNSVQANAQQVLPRNDRRLISVDLEAVENVTAGQTVDVVLTFPEQLAGFQWTLETKGLTFAGVASEDISISDQHVGVLQNGLITMSWNEEDLSKDYRKVPMSVKLQFVATQSGSISDMILLSGRVAAAEAYASDDEILDIQFRSVNADNAVEFALYQNEPNPWTGSTTISFELPEDGDVKLTLFDMSGKAVKVVEGNFKAGHQSIQLLKKDVPSPGLLYYRLESGNYSATKKMIRLE
ncbi:MAG TPA: T9SS type A sorting domain-containing protein [Saprospiraceae bacterium]